MTTTSTTSRPVLTLKRRHSGSRGAPKLVEAGRQERSPAPRERSPAPRERSPAAQEHRGNDVDLLAALQQAAPDLWNASAPVPLAVGIHRQIYPIAEQVRTSRSVLRRLLLRWTSSVAYQKALLAPGARRYNLDGSVAETVSDPHRAAARQRLEGSSAAQLQAQ